jgi:hypothetical protein
MGVRILGALVAALLAAFALLRYHRRQLRRGEIVVIALVTGGLVVAAGAPGLLDPVLSLLGFKPGEERRIIGLLVISNLFTLGLLFRGFSRDDQLANEIGELVDYIALRRLEDTGVEPTRGACAVVLPAFNESDNLPWVLSEMPKEVCGLPVVPIVVADGCTDATETTARNLGAIVIRRDLRRGSGAAVRVGHRAALQLGATLVVTMDADGQHDPREISGLVGPLISGKADMVQGSRVLGSFETESRLRRMGVNIFARLLTTLGRSRITDPSTGYRAMTVHAMRRLDLRQDQFYVSEMILDAARKGLTVREVPITLRRRASGRTKKPDSLRYAWGYSMAIVRTWFR